MLSKKNFFLIFLSFSALFSSEPINTKKNPTEKKEKIERASEALGFLIGKKLEKTKVYFDTKKILQGLNEALSKSSDLSEKQCKNLLSSFEKKIMKKQAKKNYQQAENFLLDNAKKKNIFSKEKGKLQYEILKKGEDNSAITFSSPLVRYKGMYLDGTLFSEKSEPIIITLDNIIPGFAKGIEGMKKNEIRKIYIHPDFAFGENSDQPNSLLIFEVELIDPFPSFAENPNYEIAEKKALR